MRNPTQGIEHNMVKKANNMRAIGLLFQMYAWMFKTRDIIWFVPSNAAPYNIFKLFGIEFVF